jgi:CubicO group peptidase (beta-lactamase class C family)
MELLMITRRATLCAILAAGGAAFSNPLKSAALHGPAQLLDDAVSRRLAAGYSAFLRRGDRQRVLATGVQDLRSQVPMEPDTIFRVASITKPVISAAAMILVDEGRIGLHSPIDRWIPELANRHVVRSLDGPIDDLVPASRRITLHDLLTMQMGLGAMFVPTGGSALFQKFTDLGVAPGPAQFNGSAQEFLDRLSSLPLAYHPGERWLYHTGMEVAGILVSRIAGMPLSEFLGERLTGPLGMADTAFHVPAAKSHRLATLYRQGADGKLHADDAPNELSGPPAMESGGGGLVSTALDFGRFGQMLLEDGRAGRHQILSPRSVHMMRSDQVTAAVKAASPFFPEFWDGFGWGLGLAVSTRPDAISKPGRVGWWGGTGTTLFLDPHSGTIAVLLSQSMMRSPDDTAVSNSFLQAAFSPSLGLELSDSSN